MIEIFRYPFHGVSFLQSEGVDAVPVKEKQRSCLPKPMAVSVSGVQGVAPKSKDCR